MFQTQGNSERKERTRKRMKATENQKKAILKKIQDHFRSIDSLMQKLDPRVRQECVDSLHTGLHSSQENILQIDTVQLGHNFKKQNVVQSLSQKEKRMVHELSSKLEDLYITLNFMPPFENS